MIIYDFRCELEHRFEGWFSSQADCESQLAAGQVRCPACDSSSVSRVPSALHVKSSPREPVRPSAVPVAPAAPAGSADAARGAGLPSAADEPDRARLRAAMERLRSWVANTEDVGTGFAEEARRIHHQEAPDRAIRGVATREEARALDSEGIPVLALPAHLVDKLH